MIPLKIIVVKGLSIFSILGSDEANMGLRPSILENGVLHLYIVVYHGMKHFSMLVHFSFIYSCVWSVYVGVHRFTHEMVLEWLFREPLLVK